MKNPLFKSIVGLTLGSALCLGLLATGVTRETPRTSVKGSVLLKGIGKKVGGIKVRLEPTVWIEGMMPIVTQTREDGTFSVSSMVTGSYNVTLETRAHRFKQVVELQEGDAEEIEIVAEEIEPFLSLYITDRSVMTTEAIEGTLDGFNKVDAVTIRAYRMSPDQILKSNTVYGFASMNQKTTAPWQLGEKVYDQPHTIKNRDAEGAFVDNIKIEGLKPGLYCIDVESEGLKEVRRSWANVTDTGIISKSYEKKELVYAMDVKTGAPQAGVAIKIFDGTKVRTVGMTDRNGIAKFDSPKTGSIVIMGEKGESRAFVDSYFQTPEAAQTETFINTDRPIYRPGDEVQFRGLLRRKSGSNYSLIQGGTVDVVVSDESEDEVTKFKVPVSSTGSFSGKFRTYKESDPGSYSISTTYNGAESTTWVQVSTYRKPEFEIAIAPERPVYYFGDKVRMGITCTYYFGGPVQNAKISASIFREPYWSSGGDYEEMYGEYAYSDEEEGYGGYGEFVQDLNVVTDSSGRAFIEFDATPTASEGQDSRDLLSSDYRYVIEASVTDDSGKYFSDKGSVTVVRSEVQAFVQPSRYAVAPKQPVDVQLTAISSLTDEPVPNAKMEVEAGYSVYNGKDWTFKPFATQSVTANEKGEATVVVTPNDEGDIEVRCRVQDSGGRQTESSGSIYVYGGAVNWGDPDQAPNLDLIVDRPAYMPGDTCNLVIKAGKQGGYALVTMEGAAIYSSQVVDLSAGSASVEMPVKSSYGPNLFASVCYVINGRMYQQEKRISVDLGARRLDVSVRADKSSYRPGDLATYTIQTQSTDGKGRPAEISFGVVDEAIYAIMADRTNILQSFYPKGWNSVQTRYSFEEIYLDGGDKAPKDIQIRRTFKDTAFWAPSIFTDARGLATVRFKLPDNLTTWRATAIGCTTDTSVGQGAHKVKVNKPLMVRLQAPAFLTNGDEQQLTAQITNDSGKDAEVNLELSPSTGIKLTGSTKQKIKVANGATENVKFDFVVNDTVPMVVVAKAWIDAKTSDGVELVVPVRPLGETKQSFYSGTGKTGESFRFEVLPSADKNVGEFTMSVSPSLASAAVQSLDDLIDYPYGCVEQTMSRFVPLAIVTKGMRMANLPAPKRAAEMPLMVAEGLKRLRSMQHGDGSWGWWEYDSGDPGMTGYVLEGLSDAKAAGIDVPEPMINRATEWAKTASQERFLESKKQYLESKNEFKDWATREFAETWLQLFLGMQANGVAHPNMTDPELKRAALTRPDTAAQFARLMHLMQRADDVQDALGVIASTAVRTDQLLGWERDEYSYYGFETTAKVLRAYNEIAPETGDIPKILNYLMARRRATSWISTRDTAAILREFVVMWVRNKETFQPGSVQVLVNGQVAATVTADSMFTDSRQNIRIPISQLKSGQNVVSFVGPEGMAPFYSARLRQVDVKPVVVASSTTEGLKIKRGYYRLSESLLQNGVVSLMPSAQSVGTAKEGDLVRVWITVESDRPRSFIMVEDPVPSNCRVNDRDDRMAFEEWNYDYSRMVIREDRVAFFITHLKPGIHTYSYVMRAENPGKAAIGSAEVVNMYDTDNRAISESGSFEVQK